MQMCAVKMLIAGVAFSHAFGFGVSTEIVSSKLLMCSDFLAAPLSDFFAVELFGAVLYKFPPNSLLTRCCNSSCPKPSSGLSPHTQTPRHTHTHRHTHTQVLTHTHTHTHTHTTHTHTHTQVLQQHLSGPELHGGQDKHQLSNSTSCRAAPAVEQHQLSGPELHGGQDKQGAGSQEGAGHDAAMHDDHGSSFALAEEDSCSSCALPPANSDQAGTFSNAEGFGLQVRHVCRVGQNRIYTPYMTVHLVISLPKLPYIHRIYIYIYGSGQPYMCA